MRTSAGCFSRASKISQISQKSHLRHDAFAAAGRWWTCLVYPILPSGLKRGHGPQRSTNTPSSRRCVDVSIRTGLIDNAADGGVHVSKWRGPILPEGKYTWKKVPILSAHRQAHPHADTTPSPPGHFRIDAGRRAGSVSRLTCSVPGTNVLSIIALPAHQYFVQIQVHALFLDSGTVHTLLPTYMCDQSE
jgi:hypothetical protein